MQVRVEALIILEELKARYAKTARANRFDGARHAARMRNQVLGPDLDAAEACIANDAKLVLERAGQRHRVDGEAGQVH